jgi:hypothetical protein
MTSQEEKQLTTLSSCCKASRWHGRGKEKEMGGRDWQGEMRTHPNLLERTHLLMIEGFHANQNEVVHKRP